MKNIKMMRRRWFRHFGSLGVALFEGDKGDRKVDTYAKACTRTLAPFSTGCVSGAVVRELSPDGLVRVYKAGDTTDGDPDPTRGKVQICVLEPGTVLICIGPVGGDPKQFEWAPMHKRVVGPEEEDRVLTLEQGHVIAVVYGKVETPKGAHDAPYVIFAKASSVEVTLRKGAVIMEGWR